jgi:signal transduction histidine kinase
VTEWRLAEERLRESHEALRALSARLRAVREEESARIAREVHDEIGQMLTALHLDVAWMEKRLGRLPQAREEITKKLRSMGRMLDTTMDAVHRIATELRPGVLDELGLEAAIEWYVEEFELRAGVSCRLHSSLESTALDADLSTALFRILQEALTNVARHARATEVDIRLTAEGSRVILEVSDYGAGIPSDKLADSRSLGLLGMRERARSLEGEVIVRRGRERGTTVQVAIPR